MKTFIILFCLSTLQYISCTDANAKPVETIKPPVITLLAPVVNATYTVLAPGKLVPNSEYRLTVYVENATSDTTVEAEITGDLANNATFTDKTTQVVPNGVTTPLVFKVGDLSPGTYKLRVTGKGGVEFKHENRLYLDSKNVLIFVQTDKAMYKPGQMVRFRFIATNQNLLPLNSQGVTTLIKDNNGNVINKYVDKTPENGVVSHELQLSDQPSLGDWLIELTTDDKKKFTKRFTVAEYILPTFDVDIILPSYTTINSTNFPIAVKAAYTYGKPVKGDIVLTISDQSYSYLVHNYQKRNLVKFVGSINGEITFTVDAKDFVQSANLYSSKSFSVDASVKDGLTERVYNKSKSLTVYENKYKFELLKSNRKYILGVAYTAYIKVSFPDDSPVPNNGPPVKITYSFGYRDNKQKREVSGVPENGVVKVNLETSPFEKPPKEVTSVVNGVTKTIYAPDEEEPSSMRLDAEYDGVKSNVGYIYKTSVTDKCFAQLQLTEDQMEKDFKIGDTVNLELITSKDSDFKPSLVYVVNKLGMHLHKINEPKSEEVENLPFKKKVLNFKLDIDSAPKTRYLVHGLCRKNIIAESVDIDVDGVMRTKVNVTTNVQEAKPGSEIEVLVDTAPDSSVGLLGIDQQMLLLKSGNDISKNDINNGAKKYMGCNGNSDFSSCAPRSHWYGSDPIPWEIRKSGLMLFSNLPVFIQHITTTPFSGSTSTAFAARPIAGVPQAAPIPAMDSLDSDNRGGSHSKIGMEAPRLRKDFPETWIWQMVDADKSGKSVLKSKVPDTITSFLISAFAINKETGLGLSEHKANVKVFRPFFVKLSLPYSVIRGETIALQATVYNYFKDAKEVKVTLDNSKKQFEFAVADESNDLVNDNDDKTKTITVPANDGVSVSFLIKPKSLGYTTIKVSAISPDAGDQIEQRLLVKPEGETHYKNKAFLLSSEDDKGSIKKTVDVELPKEIVEDSQRISVSAIGDVLGPAINNLDDLLRLPYGCGEQNMIRLVPNVVVLNYLSEAKRLDDKVKSKAVANIETGYQRQLTYKHNNGSFSAFGREDKSGSTWLSAFVYKSFVHAKPYVNIDEKVINETLSFLLTTQREDGSFVEIGRVLSRYMQGKSGDKTGSLTAYVLAAILADPSIKTTHSNKLTKTEEYLVKILGETSDVYEVSVITYALHLYDSKEKDNAFKKLNSVATRTPDYTYFTTNSSVKNMYGNVEITSYALMTYVLRGQTEEALPILRYLISQQNSNGGFSSTQDTVIGLQALASFAGKVSSKDPNMKVVIKDLVEEGKPEENPKTIEVNKENAIVLNNVLLSPNTKKIEIDATGQGSVLLQVSTQYNQLKGTEKPAFEVKADVQKESTDNLLKLNVCTRYLDGKESGMAVMEASLPSGFTTDVNSLDSIKKFGENVKRVETKLGNTVVVIYFDKITSENSCVSIEANRDTKLANLKPVPVTVYDYYDRSKTATVFYEPRQQKTCDICEGEDCGSSCKK